MIRLAMAVVALGASAATAQTGTFSVPPNCTAYLTIQQKSCIVSHRFTCDGDPAGYQRRADFDDQGMVYLGTIDAETRWIESYYPQSNLVERLMDGATDSASFSDLIATNLDTYDFRTDSPGFGSFRYVGSDRLTGKTVTIDGVTLEVTEFSITAYDAEGTEMWRGAGNEFISREWRMFIGGTSTQVSSTGTYDNDDTPMEFAFPGESGFLSYTPKFGCGAVMSSAPALPVLPQNMESPHDNL